MFPSFNNFIDDKTQKLTNEKSRWVDHVICLNLTPEKIRKYKNISQQYGNKKMTIVERESLYQMKH